MVLENETATTGNSDGKEIGLCVNCEHVLLEVTSKICVLCSNGSTFTNFKRAIDKPESKLCGTCSNNPKLPKKKRTILLSRTDGFPCNICVNDYFYDQI